MVFSAMRMASTSFRPSQQRLTARTILLTSTGSRSPLRLVTAMAVRAGCGEVSLKSDWMDGVGREVAAVLCSIFMCCPVPSETDPSRRELHSHRSRATWSRIHAASQRLPPAPPTGARQFRIRDGQVPGTNGCGRSSDFRVWIAIRLLGALPGNPRGFQCFRAVRSRLPLRGSSGIQPRRLSPDSLLSPAKPQGIGEGTAGRHKIWSTTGARQQQKGIFFEREAGYVPQAIGLHFGRLGGWQTRTLWVVLGLLQAALFITGFITWWRGQSRKRRRDQNFRRTPA